jgi:hypothetical protein
MDDKFELERVIMSLSREIEDMSYRLSIVEESMARLFAEIDYTESRKEEPDSEEEIGYA